MSGAVPKLLITVEKTSETGVRVVFAASVAAVALVAVPGIKEFIRPSTFE